MSKLFIVTKAPVGLDAAEMVGGFLDREAARAACRGAGTYTIYGMEPGTIYLSGRLLDTEVRVVVDHREVLGGPSIDDCLIGYFRSEPPVVARITHLPSGAKVTFDYPDRMSKDGAFTALVERMALATK